MKIRLNNDHLSVASSIMRALAHPLRLRIIRLLLEQQPVSVQTIYTNLKIEQSVASQHLRILREANLVFTERQGKYIDYLINENLLLQTALVAAQLVKKK